MRKVAENGRKLLPKKKRGKWAVAATTTTTKSKKKGIRERTLFVTGKVHDDHRVHVVVYTDVRGKRGGNESISSSSSTTTSSQYSHSSRKERTNERKNEATPLPRPPSDDDDVAPLPPLPAATTDDTTITIPFPSPPIHSLHSLQRARHVVKRALSLHRRTLRRIKVAGGGYLLCTTGEISFSVLPQAPSHLSLCRSKPLPSYL